MSHRQRACEAVAVGRPPPPPASDQKVNPGCRRVDCPLNRSETHPRLSEAARWARAGRRPWSRGVGAAADLTRRASVCFSFALLPPLPHFSCHFRFFSHGTTPPARRSLTAFPLASDSSRAVQPCRCGRGENGAAGGQRAGGATAAERCRGVPLTVQPAVRVAPAGGAVTRIPDAELGGAGGGIGRAAARWLFCHRRGSASGARKLGATPAPHSRTLPRDRALAGRTHVAPAWRATHPAAPPAARRHVMGPRFRPLLGFGDLLTLFFPSSPARPAPASRPGSTTKSTRRCSAPTERVRCA